MELSSLYNSILSILAKATKVVRKRCIGTIFLLFLKMVYGIYLFVARRQAIYYCYSTTTPVLQLQLQLQLCRHYSYTSSTEREREIVWIVYCTAVLLLAHRRELVQVRKLTVQYHPTIYSIFRCIGMIHRMQCVNMGSIRLLE